MTTILSGKMVADELEREMRKTISTLPTPPGLAVVVVGENSSSHTYIRMKRRAAENVGIHSFLHHLAKSTSEKELLALIENLNRNPAIDGILVQLPLPKQIDTMRIVEAIDPKKDVDGFHPVNMGKLLLGLEGGFVPCTPLGILTLLEKNQISIEGKHVVIVGRSNIVGKPLASLLLKHHATVTIAHSRTKNIEKYTQQADILVAAVGISRFIKAEMVKEGAVVIDVGIHREEDAQMPQGYRIVGDVDFNNVEKKCSAISPVPKGIGPMTVAMLLQNTLLSYQQRLS